MNPIQPETSPVTRISSGLRVFLMIGAALTLARVGLFFVQFQSPQVAYLLSLGVSALFLALPIIALFRAAADRWTPARGAILLILGVLLHAGGLALASSLFRGQGLGGVALSALAQWGLMLWCVGLGALLACLIRDKNLILPIAAFLAGFDVFLIFAPVTPTKAILEGMPQFFEKVTYVVPTFGAEELARIGPADFFILSMLFIVLFKFQMKTIETFRWMIPILVAYLLIVLVLGDVTIGRFSFGMLPALLPIGLTVLWINRGEFQLTREERNATYGVCVLALGLAISAFLLPTPKSEPSKSAPAPGVEAPAATPGPALPNQSP
ncbi:MAG TPA: hypothetical protein PLO61_07420 [Fimbriimonadaceae bacterium]|nr:hypothetical protein [Fimbriimonadaceae bacterium]HRJ32956.1 hypothetical protein [Fimbriimonadaceae bacterium]